MIYDKSAETMSREHMTALQGERLKQTVARLYSNVPFYKQTLDKAGIAPQDITSIDDLPRLPFTVKTDLRDNYPFGLFAVPMSENVSTQAPAPRASA